MSFSFRRCLPLLLLIEALMLTSASDVSPKKTYLLFVGTYTGKGSKGIYSYRFDAVSSQVTPLGLAAETDNPSYLAIDPSHRFLYAVNEVQKYKGASSGAVSAFAIGRGDDRMANGELSFLNELPTRGADPCYIVFDKTGKYALVANYTGGNIAVFPVRPDGRVGIASSFIQHTGSSVNRERQAGPHAHWIGTTPDNRFAIAVDLGLDKLLVYRFDAKTGKLSANDPAYAKLDPGNGPRHLAFHPNGKTAYVINELQNSITRFDYDANNGALTKRETVSTLPKEFSGSNTAAEIKIHPSARFLYASNRGHDSIAIFSIDSSTAKLTLIDHVPTQGKAPRDFEIDPTGNFLLAANQESNNIVVFRINTDTGKLTATGQIIQTPAPVCLKFVQ